MSYVTPKTHDDTLSPYYIDESTLQELLTPYGTIVTRGFVETKLNTCIAGYKFSMQFHKEANPPKSIT